MDKLICEIIQIEFDSMLCVLSFQYMLVNHIVPETGLKMDHSVYTNDYTTNLPNKKQKSFHFFIVSLLFRPKPILKSIESCSFTAVNNF